jgi:hypothetical protein
VPAGEFTAERFEALRSTCGDGVEIGDPIFACHKSAPGKDIACAGWTAVVGTEHPTLRLSAIMGDIPMDVFSPRPGWPPLFKTYDEMARTQGREDEQ